MKIQDFQELDIVFKAPSFPRSLNIDAQHIIFPFVLSLVDNNLVTTTKELSISVTVSGTLIGIWKSELGNNHDTNYIIESQSFHFVYENIIRKIEAGVVPEDSHIILNSNDFKNEHFHESFKFFQARGVGIRYNTSDKVIYIYHTESEDMKFAIDMGKGADSLGLIVEPGSASAEEVAELLTELSTLYRMVGGSGLTFTPTEVSSPEVAR